ncbi:MAG: hypothetical protein ACOYXT_29775 [Bacteroidota bacterium]
MKLTTTTLALTLCLYSQISQAQVDEIKNASAGSSPSGKSSREQSSSAGRGSFLGDFAFGFMFDGLVHWQQQKLQHKSDVPGMVSAELYLQGAAQPSSYYILHPRVRFNWGLFSAEFRQNYLVEETIEGTKHLRMDEWQILQLNLVTTQKITLRVGGGMVFEAFGEPRKMYGEWTAAFHFRPESARLSYAFEYRGAEYRDEVSANVQYHIFDTGIVHGFVSAGVAYQNYYETIDVWGMQGGMIFRLY